MNYERAPNGGIDLAHRYFAAKAGSQQIAYLTFEQTSERVRANVDRSRNNDDHGKKGEHQKHSLEISNEKIHRSEVLPDTEIKLPIAVAARLLSWKSDVEVDRTYRRIHSRCRTIATLESVDAQIIRLRRDLTAIEEQRAVELPEQGTAQFNRSFDQAQAAQRIIAGAQRADPPQAIATNATLATRIKAFR